MAAAVTALFPGAQCGIGPAIDDGYFYDFVVPAAVRARGPREASRRRCASWRRRTWSTSARCGTARRGARRSSPRRGEPLKVQLIEEKTAGQSHVSVYTIKDRDTFVDFCVGPHVPTHGPPEGVQAADDVERLLEGRRARTSRCSALYGTAFLSQKDLDAHLARIEEAKKRDHRKVGKELGLFTFHHWAPGATFWLAKGTTLYNTLADYMRERALPRRLRRGEDADRLQQGRCGRPRATGRTTARTCSWSNRATASRWASRR